MVVYVHVLVDCPTPERLYTYTWDGAIQPGDGVWVPFGSRMLGGIAVQVSEQAPSNSLKAIDSILHRGFLPPSYWQLLAQVADYYYCTLLQVVQCALPPGLLSQSQQRIERLTVEVDPVLLPPAAQTLWDQLQHYQQKDVSRRELQKQVPRLAQALRELEQRGLVRSYLHTPPPPRPRQLAYVTLVDSAAPTATPRQRAILQTLHQLGGEAPLAEFLTKAQTTRPTLQRLAEQGWLALTQREILRGQTTALPPDQPKTLTPAQAQALHQIQQLTPGQTLLLWGITGSGKTEIYLQAIQPILAAGQSALVLVPEIGLTPQLTERFQRRFPGQVWVYHSALSQGERYDCWRQMLTGTPQIVIGTRSAVFVPLPNLGMILLDEEHDGSYKQDQPAPHYHARTVAQWRSQNEGCPLVLGSATPDLTSYQQACQGTYQLAHLPGRIGRAVLPTVELVDLREELAEGNYSPLSRALQQEISDLLDRQEQGILFLNRRGFHTFILCRSCGEVLTCPNCAVSLTFHLSDHFLRCHHCAYARPEPGHSCPKCSSSHLKYFGTGTQRIEAAVQERFPGIRVLRFDRDTTQRKDSHRQILDRFRAGEADLLIGTQMLTKGLDMPQVTLIGILAADSLLNLPDYQCTERAFQLLTQVAGRSGRGQQPGRVILQTYNPTHPVVLAAQTQDFLQFAIPELLARQALGYPPFGRLIHLGWQGPVETAVVASAMTLAQYLRDHDQEVLGPAPALIPKIRQSYRWQVLWKLPLGVDPAPVLKHLPQGPVPCRVNIDP